MFRGRGLIGLGFSIAMLTAPVQAQDACEWQPSRDMRLIVTTGAGSAFDVLARAAANQWEKYFGVDVVVQNLPGAGGLLGVDEVLSSRPDGNVIGLMPSTGYLDQLIEPSFPWDVRDIPVFLGISTPSIGVLTSVDSGYETWEDVRNSDDRLVIVRWDKLTMDMPIVVDLSEHDADIATAAFDSFAPIIASIQSGDAQLWSSVLSVTAMEHVEEGTMRVLFVYSDERLPNLPDVPTYRELGMPEEWGTNSVSRMWFAPVDTPQETLDCLNERLGQLLEDPEIGPWARENGIIEEIVPGEQTKTQQEGLYEIISEHNDLYMEHGG
ncbi:Bug family tripartite tricarboxylate transporter substrate binding protein [Celeribacter indicus]|uniref:Uncharacterized protein n=1 Tax=Celeribacter indicus TaxID=1208324 RepID=A0A0B5E713_9RHOB|nr:tripartite tricarboxylate transporter substrate-binding protein [Celeribacter indicus]AJE48826.1 hypothetical protein P73_4111 [Celeribacter indicus]SDW38457.1 Tripartite-type tricarboxylate transporter, receptor component TctC [Celeribacter indicus]